jgi:hypothetical protein
MLDAWELLCWEAAGDERREGVLAVREVDETFLELRVDRDQACRSDFVVGHRNLGGRSKLGNVT